MRTNQGAWLVASPSDHRGRIGASRAAACLGKDDRCSAVQAWLEIHGRHDPVPRRSDLREPAAWGTHFEDGVVVCPDFGYAARTGYKVRRIAKTLRLPSFPQLTAHLDRIVAPRKDQPGRTVQVKCRDRFVRPRWGVAGTDDIPDAELIQMLVELTIARYALVAGPRYLFADAPVLFGGNTLEQFTIEWTGRVPQLAQNIVGELAEWWRVHIEEGTAPAAQTEDDYRRLHRHSTRTVVVVSKGDVAELALRRLLRAKKWHARADKLEEQARFDLKGRLGENEQLAAEVRRNGGPPRVVPVVKWHNEWSLDVPGLLIDQADDAKKLRERHRTINVKAFAEEDPDLFASLCDAYPSVDLDAVRKSKAKAVDRHKVVLSRGQFRVQWNDAALFAGMENHENEPTDDGSSAP